MTLCQYCFKNNMTKEEYKKLQNYITATALKIKEELKYCNGLYFETEEILRNVNEEYKNFIIQELKKLGLEFYDDNKYYRVTNKN